MKNKLHFRTRLITLLVFIFCSIFAGPAIWLIGKFIVMLGPIICATIVMLTLLGWAVYHETEDIDRRQ